MTTQKERGGLYEINEKGERVLKHQTQPRPPRVSADKEPAKTTAPKVKGKQPDAAVPDKNANGVNTL